MSIGIIEKQVLYDTPLAPLVKFALADDEDMTDDRISSQSTLDSLDDLVQSFNDTIQSCFPVSPTIETDLIAPLNTWSNLIENLHTSLRHDLKLPNLAMNCQIAMSNLDSNEIPSIDDLDDEEEEEELREKLDMHSVIISSHSFSHEPFLTAEQVISEIDFMLQDMTPDSGYCDDLQTSSISFDLKNQSIESLNDFIEELNKSIQDFSTILVEELASREELEDEKETKNTFLTLLFSIQNKRQKSSSVITTHKSTEYLTTVIPYDRQHPKYLSLGYLQHLNKLLHAINEESPQVPELLTNYILKILCS